MNETTPDEIGRMLYEKWRAIVDTTAAPTGGWLGMKEDYKIGWRRLALSLWKPQEPEAPEAPEAEPVNTAEIDNA